MAATAARHVETAPAPPDAAAHPTCAAADGAACPVGRPVSSSADKQGGWSAVGDSVVWVLASSCIAGSTADESEIQRESRQGWWSSRHCQGSLRACGNEQTSNASFLRHVLIQCGFLERTTIFTQENRTRQSFGCPFFSSFLAFADTAHKSQEDMGSCQQLAPV